jgi:hypothetical protein
MVLREGEGWYSLQSTSRYTSSLSIWGEPRELIMLGSVLRRQSSSVVSGSGLGFEAALMVSEYRESVAAKSLGDIVEAEKNMLAM